MEPYSDEADWEELFEKGEAEFELGVQRYRPAIAHYERALKFGETHMLMERRIDIRTTIAYCFFRLNSYEEVVEYDRATLKILKASPDYGIGHHITVATRYRLARALASFPKSDARSSRYLNQAVSLYKKNDCVADKDLALQTRKSLASAYSKLGRYPEANTIYEKLLEKDETRFLDDVDDESLELKHEYAAAQYHLKNYEKSKELFSQIEKTVLSLPNSRKRALRKVSQDVDKYLAACFEATLDLNRGLAGRVAASKERETSPPAPVKQNSAKDASNQPYQSDPGPVKVDRKTSGSKQRSGSSDDAAASVIPKHHASSTQTDNPQKGSQDAAPSTRKRSSKTASSPSLAEHSKSTLTLDVPSSATLKTRRSNSDHSVTRSREAIKSEVSGARSRSARSSSRSKALSRSEARPKSAAPIRPEKTSSHSLPSKGSSDSESRPKSAAPLRPGAKLSQSHSRLNAADSGSDTKGPEKKSSHAPLKSRDASDSESTPKSVVPLHPKQKSSHSLSKFTDSSDSESRTSQRTLRSDSKRKSSRPSSKSSSDPVSKSWQTHSQPRPTSNSKADKASQSASESTRPSDSKTRSSRFQSESPRPSGGESRSLHSPSGSKPSSGSESKPKSVASLAPKKTSSKDKPSRMEDSKDKPGSLRKSEPRRSRSVSAPSSNGASSAKSTRVIICPRRPVKSSKVKIPVINIQVPGSWPEDSSYLSENVEELKGLTPPKSKTRRHSLDEGAVGPLSDVSKPGRPRSESCASSETGKLYTLPDGAPRVDHWFWELRHHTHALLYGKEPKNPKRKAVRVAIIDSGIAGDCNETKVPMARWSCREIIKSGRLTYKDFTGDSSSCTDSREDLHGTLCASFLLQVAPRAELYVANVVQRKKEGQEAAHVAKAIAWAIEQEVDIISMSFGWKHEKPEVSKQIDLARGKGILLFAAASNDGPFTPEYGAYPASHHSVYCIYSCGGSGKSSEFNPPVTKFAASFMLPGEDLAVLETNLRPVAGSMRHNGTSFATPIAAGTAAIILELARHELRDSAEVERRLKDITGMTAVFQAMSAQAGEFYHVKPWKLLGERKPIQSLSNPNISHQWFTLLNVLEHLQKFGEYRTPLS